MLIYDGYVSPIEWVEREGGTGQKGERECWVVSGRTSRRHCKMRGVDGTLTPDQDREDKTHPYILANWSIECFHTKIKFLKRGSE